MSSVSHRHQTTPSAIAAEFTLPGCTTIHVMRFHGTQEWAMTALLTAELERVQAQLVRMVALRHRDGATVIECRVSGVTEQAACGLIAKLKRASFVTGARIEHLLLKALPRHSG